MMTVPANLDLDVLRTFVTGLDLGSFAKAADRLGRSQSAISLQLRKLEATTGQVLLRKQGRGLALTREGEVMLGYARRLLELNDEAVAALKQPSLEGQVRLGLLPDFAETWLPDVLGRFARAHPGVHVEARVDRSSALLDALGRGELDLTLAWHAGGESASRTEHLAWLPMTWIGPRDFARRHDHPLPLVMLEQPCLFRQQGLAALDAAGISWRLVFTSPSLSGLWAAIAAGLGITLRTPLSVPDHAIALDLKLTRLPSAGEIGLCLKTGDGSSASAAVMHFRTILRESCLASLGVPARSRKLAVRKTA
jgi:DNA-binding transcriptional LysR family regulator